MNYKHFYLKEAIADVYGSESQTSKRIEQVNQKWMQNESPWNKDGDWKMRYYRLYSEKRLPLSNKEDENQQSRRISFLSANSTPYADLLLKMRDNPSKTQLSPSGGIETATTKSTSTSILSPQSESYGSVMNSRNQSEHLGGHDTKLLNMVRKHIHQKNEESQDKLLDLPKEDSDEEDTRSETCIHGLSMRITERSMSRSRVSRISTRRDMDIQSILAYKTSNSPAPTTIPAFLDAAGPGKEDVPRWSIRRHICPVCSQKWKDRSSISNVKNSGLKRNSAIDVIPSVKASAKLRTSITLGYNPKPALAAVDEDEGVVPGRGFRNTSASWQLIRARRFRSPKLHGPPLEATNPLSATAPLAQKDLYLRVNRFIAEKRVKDTS